MAHVLHNNPAIKDPNSIRPRQIIQLAPMTAHHGPSMCFASDGDVIKPAYNPVNSLMSQYNTEFFKHVPTDPVEQEMFWALAWFLAKYDYLALPAGASLNAMGGLVGKQNNELIARVNDAYLKWKNGKSSKRQFLNTRKRLLKEYTRRLGSFDRAFFDGKPVQQAMWINKNNALPGNANILKYGARLNTLSKLASTGGIILTGIGAGLGMYNMCQTETRQEKNEILVETAAGTAASIATGIALSTFLISNPVGWGMILILGTAAAIGSYASGKVARKAYTLWGEQADLASISRIETLCK